MHELRFNNDELQVLLVALFEYRQHSERIETMLTLRNNYVGGVQQRIEVCRAIEARLDAINNGEQDNG